MLRISKSTYAEVIQKLESARVKAIVFDIIFQNADPDESEFARTLEQYNNIVIASEYHPPQYYEYHPCIIDEGT